MKRAPFYKLEPEQYLFPAICRHEGDQEQREEPVRQWAAFELIRCYGVFLSNIEFEHPVKVGSKVYRVDILIRSDGQPLAVIECKAPGFSQHEKGMQQAISYADAQDIRAEFALYTNGDKWQVSRRIQERWIPVVDLPQAVDRSQTIPINEVLYSLASVGALLADIDEALSGDRAGKFLDALQLFYNAHKPITQDSNDALLNAADNLLRVLTVLNDPIYQFGKLNTATAALERYRKSAGFILEFTPAHPGSSLSSAFRETYATISFMMDGNGDLPGSDALLLRVISALVHYGQEIQNFHKCYPPLPGSLRDAVRKHIEYGLLVNLNVSLPDPIDHGEIEDMKAYCKSAEGNTNQWKTNCPSWLRGLIDFFTAARKRR